MTNVRVLCYGDSNTWGYTAGTAERYDEDTRWSKLLESILGDNFTIIENGLNGRTTVFDDPLEPHRNGLKGLGYALISSKPIDIVVLCLGTNDLKFTNAIGAAKGIEELVRTILNANAIYGGSSPIFRLPPRILLVSPICCHPSLDKLRPESSLYGRSEESKRFGALYKKVAEKYDIDFFDAASCAYASEIDCVHMTRESHKALAEALAEKLLEIFKQADMEGMK